MNFITKNIESAKQVHYKYLRFIVLKRLKGKNFKEPKPYDNITKIPLKTRINGDIRRFFSNEENLKNVLIGEPVELDKIKNLFPLKKHKKSIKRILDYDNWIGLSFYNAYDLAKNLDIPTCPYCGRMYTKTVVSQQKGKVTRPQFDHWFAKSRYPLLALSFYNLVPSCRICNSGLKGNKDYKLDEVFHPYHKDENHPLNIKFTYKLDAYNLPSIKIKHEETDSYSKNSINAFELEEIYKAHQDELKDIIQIRNHYSDTYLEQLRRMSGVKISTKELYRLAFGTYMDEAEFDRRPLSRMKKDILIELGIIKPE